MLKRRYASIPIDRIKVLNSRNRDQARFRENVRSIEDVGLLRPVVVNDRYYKRTGYYDLVCGQGRYLAFRRLDRSEIPAELISCSKKEAYLYSLVENIARVPPGTMWFAREVKRMYDSGLTFAQLSSITGNSETYVRDYVRLVEQGEKKLIEGVEAGLFPISFAMQVARSDSSMVQTILMNAFDEGVVNSRNLPAVRRVIESRTRHRQESEGVRRSVSGVRNDYTLKQLKADITKITREKAAFVDEASVKENRLLVLLDGLSTLWSDEELSTLVASEGIGPIPAMKGVYNVTRR
jgi:ParB family chromosome partitioning protein